MQRQNVNSSNINSIGYNEVSQILEIEFSSREVYQYQNISKYIYNALMTSSSLGSYLAQNIKNKFPFRKI